MKFLLAVCVTICFVGVFCDEAKISPEDKQRIKDCAKENNFDDKMVEDLKNIKSFTTNQDTMCFIHCVLERRGMMDAAGKMTELMMKTADDGCRGITGKDKCESAAKTMNCLIEKDAAMLN